jgi:hypothetical protein
LRVNTQNVVADDAARGFKPVEGELVQHLSLAGDGGEYAVKGGQSIGGGDEQLVAQIHNVPDLSPEETACMRVVQGERLEGGGEKILKPCFFHPADPSSG